jgi:hypothetical protein
MACSRGNLPFNKKGIAIKFLTTITLTNGEDGRSKNKGKAIPLQALTGPEVSSRLRLPDFKKIGG